MTIHEFSHKKIIISAKFNLDDLQEIHKRRRDHNRLGFAYQLAFVRLANRFPVQQPFELDKGILNYVSLQLDTPTVHIDDYAYRQATISEHQDTIRGYLQLRRFQTEAIVELTEFLFDETCRIEYTHALLIKAKRFLRDHQILQPGIVKLWTDCQSCGMMSR